MQEHMHRARGGLCGKGGVMPAREGDTGDADEGADGSALPGSARPAAAPAAAAVGSSGGSAGAKDCGPWRRAEA